MKARRQIPENDDESGVIAKARTSEPQITVALRELLQRVEAEYLEMPGLSLTLSQAQRLWGLDGTTCAFVLTTLIERRVLRQAANGAYLRGPSD